MKCVNDEITDSSFTDAALLIIFVSVILGDNWSNWWDPCLDLECVI